MPDQDAVPPPPYPPSEVALAKEKGFVVGEEEIDDSDDDLTSQTPATEDDNAAPPQYIDPDPHAGPAGRNGFRSEKNAPPDYSVYNSDALRDVAQAMNYAAPPPADLHARLSWKLFLNLVPKTEDKLSKALLDDDQDEALRLVGAHRGQSRYVRRASTSNASPISRKDLHLAALFGDSEVVERLLQTGASPLYRWRGGLTALHCAAMGGYRQIAARLLHAGCPVNYMGQDYSSATALAALGEKIDVLDLLLAHNGSLDAFGGPLGSVIHAATMTGNVPLIEALNNSDLNDNWAEINRTVYATPARKLLHIARARNLLTPIDEPFLTPHHSQRLERIHGRPLALAAFLGSEAAVSYWLSTYGTDINAHTKAETHFNNNFRSGSDLHTALTLASMCGHEEVMRMLLEREASTRSANYEHADPLFLALLNGHEESGRLLLEFGAQVRSTTLALAKAKGMAIADEMVVQPVDSRAHLSKVRSGSGGVMLRSEAGPSRMPGVNPLEQSTSA